VTATARLDDDRPAGDLAPIRRRRRGLVVACLSVVAVFWAIFAWVRSTNFGGTDEWLYIALASRGVLGIPYAHRPLVLLWTVIPAWIWPNDLRAYYLAHGLYLSLSGVLVLLLCRRLAPARPLLGYLSGVFAAIWAPLDFLRLDTVLLTGYAGFTLGSFASVVLFVESWVWSSVPLLAFAGLVGFVAARGFEGVLPVLAVAPVLLWALPTVRPGLARARAAGWIAAWEALVVFAALLAVWPVLHAPTAGSYQTSALRLDLTPSAVASRMVRQFGYHLLPVVTSPPRELATPAVPVAVAVFALGYVLLRRADPADAEPDRRADLVRLSVIGLLLAAAGYSAFTLTGSILGAARTQFLSTPGIGIALAAAVLIARSWLPRSSREVGTGLLAAWIVALAASRTVAMQTEWDLWRSRFPVQQGTLAGIIEKAPDLKPGTLIVLLDETAEWPTTFTFRHAVEHLYAGHVLGMVWGANEFLYPTYFRADGVYMVPWPVIREGWSVQPTFHRYDQLLVARLDPSGLVTVLEAWPTGELPPLPDGERYDPHPLIERDRPEIPERAILGRSRPRAP